MTDEKKPDQGESATKPVHCRRTGQDYHPETHVQCPYCYGEEGDVATGDHANFCDFKPGKDPVNFGFPGDSERLNRG